MNTPLTPAEIAAATDHIGTDLVKETASMRIWHLRLAPGQGLPPHRHECPYFWTALSDGTACSRTDSGRILDVTYRAGDTVHFPNLGAHNSFVHDITNTGDRDLLFVTVEFKPEHFMLNSEGT